MRVQQQGGTIVTDERQLSVWRRAVHHQSTG
jgi:hypothetical protein